FHKRRRRNLALRLSLAYAPHRRLGEISSHHPGLPRKEGAPHGFGEDKSSGHQCQKDRIEVSDSIDHRSASDRVCERISAFHQPRPFVVSACLGVGSSREYGAVDLVALRLWSLERPMPLAFGEAF